MDIFARHKKIIGEKGLTKLKESSVLIAGVGGLGTYVSEQLTRLGVGKLYLVDNGIVDLPDLNRQTLYTKDSIGKLKVDEAKKRLSNIRDDIEIIKIKEKIDENFKIPEDVNIVSLCLDNIKTRLILDEKLIKINKNKSKKTFLVHSGVDEYLIQIITIDYNKIPSLRFIFEEYEEKNKIFVIPQTVAIAGGFQSLEIMNILLNKPNLIGKSLMINLKNLNLNIIDLI